jgi:hypothetical protein
MSNVIEETNIKKNKKTFPYIKDYSKLQLTSEGLYSVSGYDAGKKLVYLILKYFNNNKNIIITDATSNNGSDTIPLAQTFIKVNAIEKNDINHKALVNNIEQYGLNNVNVYNDDLMNILTKTEQDVIYIDAPWKRKMDENYKEHENLKLYIGEYEISQVFNMFKNKCKLFIFKIPINYDFSYFIHNTMVDKYYIHSYKNHNTIKFYYIFINCYKNV